MEKSLLDLFGRAESDPVARASLDEAMRTVYDDMPSHHAYVLDSLASDFKGKNSFAMALQNAQSGVTVKEAREGLQEKNLQSLAGPTPEDYGSQLLGDYLAESASVPGAAPDSPDSFDVLTFDKVMKFAKERPKPPNLAQLEDPSALSLLIAGLVASQRPDKAAEIMALPFQWQTMQKADADARSKMEYDAALKQHDQDLDLMVKRFDTEGRDRSAQADRESRERIAQDAQKAVTGRHEETLKAQAERDFWRNVGSGKMPPTAAYVLARDSGHFSPETLDEFKAEAERRENATVGKSEAQIKEIETRARLDESRILTDEAKRGETERKNKLFDATFEDEVKTVKERLKGYGLSNALKDLQRKKLEVELPYVDDEIIAGLAATRARAVYTQQLTQASKDKNAAVDKNLDLEIGFLTEDLEKDRQSLKEIEGKATEAKAKGEGESKAGNDDDAAYWKEVAAQYEKARKSKSAEIEAANNALRDLRRQANDVRDRVPPVNPMSIEATPTGRIGK